MCHGEGPLLVVAGAGTGKTQVITRRIAWLIATRRARPSEILALTFTDKAADEMQARVDQLVPYGYTDAAISTFHAFGDRLVREFALELGLPTDSARPFAAGGRDLPAGAALRVRAGPVPAARRPDALPRRAGDALQPLQGRGRRALRAYLDSRRDLAAALDGGRAVLGAGRWSCRRRRLRRTQAAALEEEARRQTELARAYERYQKLLREAGLIDFGDQVSLALRLLRESPAARLELQRRFRYILVDEFQDTNRAQSELVELLGRAARERDRRRRRRPVDLQVPRRGHQQHPRVQAAPPARPPDRAAAQLPSRAPPSWTRAIASSGSTTRTASRFATASTNGWSPSVGHGAAGPASASSRPGPRRRTGVAREIAARVAAGARPRDFAVLVRANADADPVLRSLNLAGVPWRFSGTSGLYARPEIRLLLAFLRADRGSVRQRRRVRPGSVRRLRPGRPRPDGHRQQRPPPEPLALGGARGADAPARAAAARRPRREPRWSGWSPICGASPSSAHERPAGEVLYQFLRESGLLSRLASADSVAAEEALQNIARFFDIIRAQSDLLPDDRVVFVARHLQTLIDAGDDPATAEVDPDADAVAVLTVHKAKGLEFPVVYMTGLVDGRFPARTRREPLALPARAGARDAAGGRRPRSRRSGGSSTWA